VTLQLADELVRRRIVDAACTIRRRRQQVLASEVKPDIKDFIFVTRQRSQTPALVDKTTANTSTYMHILTVNHSQ